MRALRILAVLVMTLTSTASGGEDDRITIPTKVGVYELEDLLAILSRETGRPVVLDSDAVAHRKVEFIATNRVPREQLLPWFRSLLRFQNCIAASIGDVVFVYSKDEHGPRYVPVADIEAYADREGVRIMTLVELEHVDPEWTVRALSQLSTRKTGRLRRVPGRRSFLVVDDARVVVSMVRLVRAMDLRLRLKKERKARIERYESLLAAARTERAAVYFVSRIQEIRREAAPRARTWRLNRRVKQRAD